MVGTIDASVVCHWSIPLRHQRGFEARASATVRGAIRLRVRIDSPPTRRDRHRQQPGVVRLPAHVGRAGLRRRDQRRARQHRAARLAGGAGRYMITAASAGRVAAARSVAAISRRAVRFGQLRVQQQHRHARFQQRVEGDDFLERVAANERNRTAGHQFGAEIRAPRLHEVSELREREVLATDVQRDRIGRVARRGGDRKRIVHPWCSRFDPPVKKPAPLGQPPELAEVGLAFLEVGVAAFLAFFGQVEQQRRVAGEFLQAGLAVAVGIQRGLQAASAIGLLASISRHHCTVSSSERS
jgi:hypothetical protein